MSLAIFSIQIIALFLLLGTTFVVFVTLAWFVVMKKPSDEWLDLSEWANGNGTYNIYRINRDWLSNDLMKPSGSRHHAIVEISTMFGFGKQIRKKIDIMDSKTFNNRDGSSLIISGLSQIIPDQQNSILRIKRALADALGHIDDLKNRNAQLEYKLREAKKEQIQETSDIVKAVTLPIASLKSTKKSSSN